jgi:hypothetical protein
LKFEGLASTGNTGVVSVSFDLYGSNTTAVTISSSVNLGATTGASNFTELRDSINAYTAQTGVEAVLATDFSYLYLTQNHLKKNPPQHIVGRDLLIYLLLTLLSKSLPNTLVIS